MLRNVTQMRPYGTILTSVLLGIVFRNKSISSTFEITCALLQSFLFFFQDKSNNLLIATLFSVLSRLALSLFVACGFSWF